MQNTPIFSKPIDLSALQSLIQTQLQYLPPAQRLLIALVGAPAAGKSTLAAQLSQRLNQTTAKPETIVVPMDGFHLDNGVLQERGLLARKGAPETFDVAGFKHLLQRLRTETEVIFPLFDRSLDKSIAGAGQVQAQHRCVIVEGNYLLLDEPVWADLASVWNMTVSLDVPLAELERRLLQRWLDYGYSAEVALAKAQQNDLPNAQRIVAKSRPADYVLAWQA